MTLYITGLSESQRTLIELRHAFIVVYCAEHGLMMNDLTIAQILEIRSMDGWKNPSHE
mgnify:CR=1 FL=1